MRGRKNKCIATYLFLAFFIFATSWMVSFLYASNKTVHSVEAKTFYAQATSTKLSSITANYDGFALSPSFDADTYEYDLKIPYSSVELNLAIIPVDSNATVTVTGNKHMLNDTGIITITVSASGISSTVYKINYSRLEKDEISYTFDYTGDSQSFVVPFSGDYRIELWGAQGGNYDASLLGGAGGYTKGEIYLNRGTELFLYVGGQPSSNSTNLAGGYNGGGNAPAGKDKDGRAGGGATDVRLISGPWNNVTSLRSRIMVAGGGGGAAYEYSDTWRSNGGAGGGLNGLIPSAMGSSASSKYGTGGTQTAGGYSVPSNMAVARGTFGIGGTGYMTDGGSGGGGGYYGGGGSYQCSGGGGGSSFISGHNGCNAIDEDGNHTGTSTHYSNYVFTNTTVIDGEGYNWTDTRGDKIDMPTHDGTTTMVGNSGNGYVKITNLTATRNNYLSNIEFTTQTGEANLSETFNSDITEYTLTIGKYDLWVEVNGILDDSESIIVGNGKYYVDYNTTTDVTLSVTNGYGEVRNYLIHVQRDQFSASEHTSKLSSLGFSGFEEGLEPILEPEFSPLVYEYNLELLPNILDVEFAFTTFDSEAEVKVENNRLLLTQTGTITITVTEPHSTATVYKLNYSRVELDQEYAFSYTGDYQTFIAPYSGYYNIELWGAQGGNYDTTLFGGAGGYTKGRILLKKGTPLYIYIGSQPSSSSTNLAGGYNGGGNTPSGKDADGRAGGGATDVRLMSGLWNDVTSLRSRIMVAGGGGGAAYESSANWRSNGGAGGGLKGLVPTAMGSSAAGNYGTGGTQTTGGYATGSSGTVVAQGTFGAGGRGISTDGGSGGGGGYYGGGGSNVCSGGGGGSSFISGHTGCDAIDENGVHTGTSTHYSNYVFLDTVVIDGDGYSWTDVRGEKTDMPTYDGTATMTGNTGNGYAKITPLTLSKNNYLLSLETDHGTLSPAFDSLTENYEIVLDKYESFLNISGEIADPNASATGFGRFELALDEEIDVPITVTAQDGSIRVYNIHISRPGLAPGEHSTKLASLAIDEGRYLLTPEFESGVTEYDIEIPAGVMALDVTYKAYDKTATVSVKGNSYIKLGQSGTITVTVSASGVADTVYKINVGREGVITQSVFEFDYTGDYQTFTAQNSGFYQLEVWGAQGGGMHQNSELGYGGAGGYSTGTLYLAKGQTLYIYVGGEGSWCGGRACIVDGGYNGGGNGRKKNNSGIDPASSGGGATDIRLVPGAWDSDSGLYSRFIVAGGGGGGGMDGSSSGDERGGDGGGLNGVVYDSQTGLGGGQTSGWAFGKGFNATDNNSQFINGTYGGQGAGGGWYGGSYSRGSRWEGAGGGSGFVLTAETVENVPEGYSVGSTYYLTDAETIAGNQQMPSKSGGYTTGNKGNGYAKITLLPSPSENNFLSSITVKINDEVHEYTPEFDLQVEDYYLDVLVDETKVEIQARPEDSTATITGIGKFEVLAGENIYPITVTAENGDIKEYRVHVTRPASSNPYPNDITISGLVPSLCSSNSSFCQLSPLTFDKDTTTYYLTVPSRIKQIYFNVEKGHDYQTVSGEGKVTLDGGENIFTIEVVSEDGTNQAVYTYYVTRDMTGNTDLSRLEVVDPLREINYDPDITEYYLSIPNDYTEIKELVVETDDPNASYIIVGNENLETGMNQIGILVTAANGETKNYVLNVYREKSSNVYLADLQVKSEDTIYTMLPEFNKVYTGTYHVTVPNDITSIEIVANSEASTTSVTGVGVKELQTGINNYTITTTSEDGNIELYTLAITREKNSNTNLESIIVKDSENIYDLTPIFDKDTLEYETTVLEGVSNITIEATTEVDTTTYRLLDNSSLRVGENTKRIMVIAEDGSSKIYTITIIRPASSNNYLSNITLSDGYLVPTFDKTVTTYDIKLDNSISSITVTGIKENELATLKGNGKYSLAVGTNEIKLTVTSEDGNSREYILNVTRDPNSNADLSMITTSVGILVPSFDKDTLTYSINVENTVDKIVITGTPAVSTTTVTGNDTYSLESGHNIIELVTLAEDGTTTKTYTVDVYKDKSDNDNLDSLILKEAMISPTFDSNIIVYSATVPYEITSANFIVKLEDSKASYQVLNNENLSVGTNEVIIRVTSESGKTKDYTVNITRESEEQSSSYLTNLTVDHGTLTPTFTKDQLFYQVEVPYTVSQITTTVTLEDSNASQSGSGTYNLTVGENLIGIRITSITGETRDYQILVTRKGNTEARLSSLSVNGSILSPTFHRDTYEYSLSTTLDELVFTNIEPVDQNATYEIIGNQFTENKDYTVVVRVTAQDKETVKDYILHVTKNPSNNNNLADLSVEGYTITPSFNKATTLYTLTVGEDVNSILIHAKAEDEKAVIDGAGTTEIKVGENQITIRVTSESGNVKAYTLVVTKEGSNNNNLANLIVNNGVMNPTFDKDTTTYDVTVDGTEESLDLTVLLENENATYHVVGNHLNDSNTVLIVVTAEDGSVKTYTLNVTKSEIVSNLLKELSVTGYQLSPIFNSHITEYSILVNNETTSLDITAIPLDKNATVEITGNENFAVGMNDVYIKVTASDNTTETYTIHVNRQIYANTFLDYFYTSEGDVTPAFDKNTTSYTIEVENSVTEIEFFGEAVDKSTTVTGLGIHKLVTGENQIPVTVTSTSGISRTYYITVIRKKATDNYLETLTVKVGNTKYTLTPEFDKTINYYQVTVPVGTKEVTLEGTISKDATVTGLGNRTITVGDNTLEINVTSENDVTNTYVITVTRPASDNNYLTELIPNVGSLEPVFTYGNTDYTLNLDSGASVLYFTYSQEDLYSTVTGYESQVIPDGISTRTIIVTAEDGSTRTYTITVNKERSDNAKLSDLKITGFSFEETFDPDTYLYHVTVPNDKKNLTAKEVIAVSQDDNATIQKTGDMKLYTTSLNEYVITVTAPDGFTTQDYRIIISREKGNSSLLSDLKVNIGFLTETFSPEKQEYVWKIPKSYQEVTSSDVSVTLEDAGTYQITDKLSMLTSEDKYFTITVTSEDGTSTTTYKLKVEYDLSIDATLASLTIDKGYYLPDFNSEIYHYDVYEYIDTTEIEVFATPTSATSTVIAGNGTVSLTSDETEHTITVQAEDGTVETYTLTIHKTVSTDKGLMDLGLLGLDDLECKSDQCLLSPTFTEDIISYSIKVPYEYTDLQINAVTKNSEQTVKYRIGTKYFTDYELPMGKTNVIVEVYDGMNTKTMEYALEIERCKSANTYLSQLEVEDYILSPEFDKSVLEYSIEVPAGVNEVSITAIPEFSESIITMNGYNYLQDGNNDVEITVTAPDGSTRTYILHVIRNPQYNSYIKNITVSTGIFWDLSPKFNKTTYEYTTTVSSIYNKVTIEAVPVDSTTTILGTGEYELVTGSNIITLVATAIDGSTSTYRINVIKEISRNVNLSSLIVEEGNLSPSFEKGTTKYDINVDENTSQLTIHAIPEDSTSTVIINGNNYLKSGDNIVNVIVMSSDKSASKTYQLTVHKEKSSNNYLANLQVLNDSNIPYDIVPEFNREQAVYSLELDSDVDKVKIVAEAENEYAIISGIGEEYLSYGLNAKTVTVTSENGEVRTYDINIYRNYNLNLKAIISDIGDITPTFDKDTLEYRMTLPNNEKEITFIAQRESDKVKVTGSGTYKLQTGENEILFVVTAPDNKTKIYKVIVEREKSTNNYIESLVVHQGKISPTFDKETSSYEVSVRNTVTQVDMDIVLEDSSATYEIIGNQFTGEGDYEVTIRVTAENGDKRDYTLIVHVEPDAAFSNRLLDLTVSSGQLTPDFDPDINYYAVTVANSIQTVEISGVKENVDAKVEGLGVKELSLGRNVFQIEVTSKDDILNTYTVVIYRTENSDATLASLTIKNYSFHPIFNKLEENYQLEVGSEVTSLEIEAIPTDSNASVVITGNDSITTGTNIVTILVTAPDNITTKTYTLTVTKGQSTNNYLSSITVSGYTLSPEFNKTNQGPYVVNVSPNVNNVIVDAKAEVDTTTITGIGSKSLTSGQNVVSIQATSESGEVRVYTVIINKGKNSDSTLKSIMLSDSELIPTFNSNVLEYTINVDNSLESINITGLATASTSTVTGNGSYTLTDSLTVVPLVVEAEDGSKTTYTLKVVKESLVSSLIEKLVIKEGEIKPDFHKNTLDYTVTVPYEITSLDMLITLEDVDASYVVNGNSNFKVGDNTVEIVVTAKDNSSTTTYTIHVNRQTNASNYLSSLSVVGYDLVPEFNKTTLYYEVTVPKDTETIQIKATKEDSSSVLSGTGYKNITYGENRFYVKVESASGSVRTYSIVVNRSMEEENYLLSLESDIGTLSPTFDKEVNEYTLTLPEKTTEVTLTGTASLNTTVLGLGKSSVIVGEQQRTITVTSQSGVVNTYTVNIIRTASTNTNLVKLVPSNGTLEYSNDILEYTMEVDDNVSVLSFEAVPEDSDAKVTGVDLQNIEYGENIISIVVTAEDKTTTRNITVKVIRQKEIVSIIPLDTDVVLRKDEEKQLGFTLNPTDTSYPEIKWISNNEEIVSVDQDGNVIGLKVGYTTIEIVSIHNPNIKATINVEVIETEITSDIYEIHHDTEIQYLIGLDPKTSVTSFISNLNNNPSLLHVYNEKGDEITDTKQNIGSNMIIKLIINETVYDELVIVVRGDFNGDGLVTVADQTIHKNMILGKVSKTFISEKIADINKDDKITVADLTLIKNYILGKGTLN